MKLSSIVAALINTDSLPKSTADQTTQPIQIILNIVFAFSASIAVLIIVVCGFRYIVAHGDPNATAQAKNGILYSIVGLVIVMAAYSIVTFVIKAIM
jgi:type IV secretory pathway VirB2 component (pilin)